MGTCGPCAKGDHGKHLAHYPVTYKKRGENKKDTGTHMAECMCPTPGCYPFSVPRAPPVVATEPTPKVVDFGSIGYTGPWYDTPKGRVRLVTSTRVREE